MPWLIVHGGIHFPGIMSVNRLGKVRLKAHRIDRNCQVLGLYCVGRPKPIEENFDGS